MKHAFIIIISFFLLSCSNTPKETNSSQDTTTITLQEELPQESEEEPIEELDKNIKIIGNQMIIMDFADEQPIVNEKNRALEIFNTYEYVGLKEPISGTMFYQYIIINDSIEVSASQCKNLVHDPATGKNTEEICGDIDITGFRDFSITNNEQITFSRNIAIGTHIDSVLQLYNAELTSNITTIVLETDYDMSTMKLYLDANNKIEKIDREGYFD